MFEDVVDDLRWALATLPGEDSPAPRCRLLLALAVELDYDRGAAAKRDALVNAGLAAARRIGDDRAVVGGAGRLGRGLAPDGTADQVAGAGGPGRRSGRRPGR